MIPVLLPKPHWEVLLHQTLRLNQAVFLLWPEISPYQIVIFLHISARPPFFPYPTQALLVNVSSFLPRPHQTRFFSGLCVCPLLLYLPPYMSPPCFPFHMCPLPCIPIHVCPPPCVPFRVFPSVCVSLHLFPIHVYSPPCVPLRLYLPPYMFPSVYFSFRSVCVHLPVSTSVYVTLCVSFCVYIPLYVSLFLYVPHHISPSLCVSYFVCVYLRVCLPRVCLPPCVPSRLSPFICSPPYVTLRVCPPCVFFFKCVSYSVRVSHSMYVSYFVCVPLRMCLSLYVYWSLAKNNTGQTG